MAARRDRQMLPRAFAGKILTDLRVEDPDELLDVDAIAAHYNCFVRSGGLRGADGRVYSNGREAIIRVRADITDERRRRFIVAHELGHVRMKHERTLEYCTDADLVRYNGVDAEPEANAFASELLMPAKMFRPRVAHRTPTFDLVEDLAEAFTTTFTATAIRLVDLSDDSSAVVWSEAGRVKWCITSPDCGWFVRSGSMVTREAFAFDAMRLRRTPEQGFVPGDAWLEGRDVPDEVHEETRWFSGLGAAFTLLREK